MSKIVMEGKKYNSLKECIKSTSNKKYKVVYREFKEKTESLLKQKKASEKSKIENETYITVSEFCELVKKHSNMIEDIYENENDKNNMHNILCNLQSLYDNSIINQELSVFLKLLNFARLSSVIKLSRGQMIYVLKDILDVLLLENYEFIDFVLHMYDCGEKSKEDTVIIVLEFFGAILDQEFKFTEFVNNILETMSISQKPISEIIKSALNKPYNEIINSILDNTNKLLDKSANTFLDEYMNMTVILDEDETENIMKNILNN